MTSPESRIRVYVACSVDGFIAGEDGDLSWLPGAEGGPALPVDAISDEGALAYSDFISGIGALLIGRGCYDTASGFESWPYGDLPVFVATHRPLEAKPPTVTAVSGVPQALVDAAKERAAGKDVYLDGGELIRQVMDAGLVDDLVITQIPVVLGRGIPLFAGVTKRHPLELVGHYRFMGSMLQLYFRPR
jgi:dihydrofolate reductase